jgi:hypothetical protein
MNSRTERHNPFADVVGDIRKTIVRMIAIPWSARANQKNRATWTFSVVILPPNLLEGFGNKLLLAAEINVRVCLAIVFLPLIALVYMLRALRLGRASEIRSYERSLLNFAVAQLPPDQAERYREEWEADLLNCSGIGRIARSVGMCWAGWRIGRAERHHSRYPA